MFKPLLSLQAQLMSVWHTPVTVARDFTEVCCYHWTNSYWWAFQAGNLRTPDPGSLPGRSFWWFLMPGWLINLFRARLIWTCPPLFCVLVCLMWTLSCVAQTLPSHGISTEPILGIWCGGCLPRKLCTCLTPRIPGNPWEVMPGLYFHRDPEGTEKDELKKAVRNVRVNAQFLSLLPLRQRL